MKFKFYTDQVLKKEWVISTKLDGVHVIIHDGTAYSKAGNKLKNLEFASLVLPDGRYELFDTDWSTSISACKNDNGEQVNVSDLYRLDELDDRLYIYTLTNPTEGELREALYESLDHGYEGIVITRGNRRFKLKDEVTVDVRVTGMVEGTGRLRGKLGALETNYGKIGTGFDDKTRAYLWNERLTVGSIVEAKCQGFTSNNKMRHARYIRARWDKNCENLEGLV